MTRTAGGNVVVPPRDLATGVAWLSSASVREILWVQSRNRRNPTVWLYHSHGTAEGETRRKVGMTTAMQHLWPGPLREHDVSAAVLVMSTLVRFFALRRINPTLPLLVRAPVNSFEF